MGRFRLFIAWFLVAVYEDSAARILSVLWKERHTMNPAMAVSSARVREC